MNERDYLWSLKVDQDWVINMNAPIYNIVFDETVLFNTYNLKIGRELSIIYQEENSAFILIHAIYRRYNGAWNIDEAIHKELARSTDIDDLYDELHKYINPCNKKFIPIKIFGGWNIRNNKIIDHFSYEDTDLVFFAVQNKYYIEVVFDSNNDQKFILNVGLLKYKIENYVNEIKTQNIDKTKKYFFSELLDVINFIELFMIDPTISFNDKI